MAEVALKKLEEQLNCLICLDTYTDPKQLQCFHVFCRQCLVKLVIRDQQGQLILTCPTCRQVTPVPANGVAGLQSAFNINHLLDILEEHKQASVKEGAAYCADHQEREMELYCETCEKLICFQCTIKEHHGHQYNLVKEVLEKYKQEIMDALAPAKQQLTEVRKASKQVDTRMKEILDQQATLEAKIYKKSQQLVDAIKARTNKHVSKLRHITEQKIGELASQMERMDTTEAQLSSYLNMIGEALTSSGQEEVMKIKATISEQVKELTDSFQTDMLLEPIAQADVEFSASREVLEVCQGYGEVVVLGSPDPSKCLVTGKSLKVTTVGELASVDLQAVDFMGLPCRQLIQSFECELLSEIAGTRESGTIERKGQSKYTISFRTTVKGRHQLHIKAEGKHIRESPFSVAAKATVEKLGTAIKSIGGMYLPWGVAINHRGEVIVTEECQHCISVFSPSGEKLRCFGTHGTSQSQFRYPNGVVVNGEGDILVVDCKNHRIQKFTASGQFLTAVGTKGNGPLQFSYPKDIAVNCRNNKVYVTECRNNRIQVLNSDLTYSNIIGRKGSGRGQFDFPHGISCDSAGNVYVADTNNHHIQVFTAEGNFLKIFWGWSGGELNWPVGIAVDTSNLVYVTDSQNNCVCVFNTKGQLVTLFGKRGEGLQELQYPLGVTVDSHGIVYVCDFHNYRVQFF